MNPASPPGRPRSAVRQVDIGASETGQRIDNFLAKHLKGVPKSHIYRILREGQVRVNRGRIKADYRLQTGDTVRIPPLRLAEEGAPVRPPDSILQRLRSAILYEDDALLILNKPSGLAVHAGSQLPFGVIECLRALRPEAPFLELAHRLDRETSGCLILAKQRPALLQVHQLLKAGALEKRYLLLAAGKWQGGAREVRAALEKNAVRSGERMVQVSDSGRYALTRFQPVDRFRAATLLEALLDTGRTHQIRVHAAHIGHPLAGDDKYGDSDFNRLMAGYGLKRLFLHAQSVGFTLPGGISIDVSTPLSDDLKQVLDRLVTA